MFLPVSRSGNIANKDVLIHLNWTMLLLSRSLVPTPWSVKMSEPTLLRERRSIHFLLWVKCDFPLVTKEPMKERRITLSLFSVHLSHWWESNSITGHPFLFRRLLPGWWRHQTNVSLVCRAFKGRWTPFHFPFCCYGDQTLGVSHE